MPSAPVISAIMPVTDSGKHVKDCIRSILEQSFPDFELIVINITALEKLTKIIKSFNDTRIKVPVNIGNFCEALNMGLMASQGEYICIIDTDDISLPCRFERQVRFMEQNPETGLAGSGYKVFGDDKELLIESDYEKIKVRLLRSNSLVHSSLIMRNRFIKKYNLQYVTGNKSPCEYDFLLRAARCFPVTGINEALLIRRVNQKQDVAMDSLETGEQNDEICISQLRYLGLFPDEVEETLHIRLLRGRAIDHNNKERLDCWIRKIKEANRNTGYYDPAELESFLVALLSLQPFCRSIVREDLALKTRGDNSNKFIGSGIGSGIKLCCEVLTLLSGNPLFFKQWNEVINQLEFSCQVVLRILDNSGSTDFNNRIKENIPVWKRKFTEVSVISYLEPYKPIDPDDYLERGRHTHVAELYSKLFSQVKSDLVLTFEEDIVPPLNAFKLLIGKINIKSVGAIGCAYSSPKDKNVVCAAFGIRRWGTPVPWLAIKGQLIPVDYMGGGFTLWNLSRLPGKVITHDWNRSLGWDAVLCERIRETGLKIILAGDIICQHNNKFIK